MICGHPPYLVRIVEARPHYCKGTPALAGYLGANTRRTDGGVDFVRNGSARNVGAFPGRDLRCAEVPLAWKTVIPRTNINCVILNYNCIITRLKCQIVRRCSPYV